MTIPFSLVDAFTNTPFGGNPAVVCLVEAWPDAGWMQRVAAEMNAGATAFLHRNGDHLELRWFSPAVELDMCGHGTLATAHMLWESGGADDAQPLTFQTRAGALHAVRDGDRVVLDFPALLDEAAVAPEGLLAALGVSEARFVGRSRFDYLVEVESDATVRTLRPDLTALGRIETRGVIVTARSTAAGIDFVSRFFAPRAGIAEDHATGSAHCCLAPFWSRQLGRTRFVARQLSPRGATLYLELQGERVRIGGEAVTVARGHLTAAAPAAL